MSGRLQYLVDEIESRVLCLQVAADDLRLAVHYVVLALPVTSMV